ncbi:MAG: acetoin utilization protein AcuC [Actinomycetota bacterium]|nr:acetoin utilization protein AcuC [Actinomycetota bacterium]
MSASDVEPESGCHACSVFADTMTAYDFGPAHPMAPVRIDLTMRLARALGVLGDNGTGQLSQVETPAVDDDLLLLVHEPAYVDAVKRVSADPGQHDLSRGLGTPDNPTFAGMHEASARVVSATAEAARQVWSGVRLHAASIAGGLHHAMPGLASGFCVYNDPAVAIAWLLQQGATRVAYVDVDVHHGDGVQHVFYHDTRVLTVSLHETPQTLFPGTGAPDEIGGRGAEGSAVNVALPPGTSDDGWLRAFHAVVPDVLRAFGPQVLVTQHGCDGHKSDPLAHLMLSVDGQRASYIALHELAHELCEGLWVATGGGGYSVTDVVPRAWTHLLAIVAGQPLEAAVPVPEPWQRHVRDSTGAVAPSRMTDGQEPTYRDWGGGYDPGSWLDRSVHATRVAAFPAMGLDPHQ